MPNLNAVAVPTAVDHKTKLDLSHDFVSTMGFMRPLPVFHRRMMRGEHINIKCDSTVRLAPVEVPFFGSLVQNIRYFAVKLSQIFPNWYSFYNDNIGSNASDSSLVSAVPTLPGKSLVSLFTEDKFNSYNYYHNLEDAVSPLWSYTQEYFEDSRVIEIDGVEYTFAPGWYTTIDGVIAPNTSGDDIIYQWSNSAGDFYTSDPGFDYQLDEFRYRYDLIGRRFLYILESLGYKVIYSSKADIDYNAFGLLALCRCYVDWYANSQYLNSEAILTFERLCKYNDPTGHLSLNSDDLNQLLYLVSYVVYDTDDYFTNAYDNPTSAVSGQFSGFSVFDPTSTGGAYVRTNANGTPEMTANSDYPLAIGSTYIHEALKRLTDYQKRHQLSARSIDRVLAQYGAVPSNLKMERSIYLGHQVNIIKSGAVMSTANGSSDMGNSSVGDYAGAGFGQSSDVIDFKCDDECIILAIATIIPQGNIVQGYDRQNRALSRFEFYQPEMDFGISAIEKGEVYVSNIDTFAQADDNGQKYDGVFGFTGAYGADKRPKSYLVGDFSLPRLFAGGDSWHLFRMFNDESFGNSSANIVHSLSFSRSADNPQYHRIFQYTNHDYDPFMCFIHFDISSYAPCKPLFDTYDFDSNGTKVDISNGNKVN